MNGFNSKSAWQTVATLKYKNATMRKTKKSLMFVSGGKIVAVFSLAHSNGIVI